VKCPKCGSPGVLVESKPNGDKHIKCAQCGLNEVRDKEGRKLLLDAGSTGDVLLS
jgi:ssDNA-binding Zn-finger/Zn-ribbon topoisomerase 1